MTETPTERAARALYVHECGTRDVQIEQAHKYWDDCRSRKWVDIKIASMAAALEAYANAVSEQYCYGPDGKHNGPGRNGCCLRGLMGVGEGCNDCPAKAEPTVAQVSAARRERAVEAAAKHLCTDTPPCSHCRINARETITTYERVMAEPDAPQPRKEEPTGETSDTLGRSIWGAGQARKEGA